MASLSICFVLQVSGQGERRIVVCEVSGRRASVAESCRQGFRESCCTLYTVVLSTCEHVSYTFEAKRKKKSLTDIRMVFYVLAAWFGAIVSVRPVILPLLERGSSLFGLFFVLGPCTLIHDSEYRSCKPGAIDKNGFV